MSRKDDIRENYRRLLPGMGNTIATLEVRTKVKGLRNSDSANLVSDMMRYLRSSCVPVKTRLEPSCPEIDGLPLSDA